MGKVKITFDSLLSNILWALKEQAELFNQSVEERFSYIEKRKQYSPVIDEYTTEITCSTQAGMLLLGHLAGKEINCVRSLKIITSSPQLNGKYRCDCIDGKKGEITIIYKLN